MRVEVAHTVGLGEAREVLRAFGAASNDPNGYALAIATVELAEQQRIANLIALAALQQTARPVRDGAWFALHDNPITSYGDYTLKPAIAEGLGL